MSGLLLLCGLRWGPDGPVTPGDDDRGTHVCGLTSPHQAHRCFLCGAGDEQLTFCPDISDNSLEVRPRRPG